MKTIKSMSVCTKSIASGIFLSVFLLGIPLQAWSLPEDKGDKSCTKEWMTQALEITSSDFEAELALEEWMTQAFEIPSADDEAELALEEWMTQAFEIPSSDDEAELMVEEWMTQPFDAVTAVYDVELGL